MPAPASLAAHARGRHHRPRRTRGAAGPGAPRPAAAGRARAHRGRRRRRQLRRHDGAQGLYPDAPKPPMVVGYEVAGTVARRGDGVDGDRARRPRDGGHALRRLRLAGRRRRGASRAAARAADLRAGRRDPGQLRDRLGGAASATAGCSPASACWSTRRPAASGSPPRRSPSATAPRCAAPPRRPSTRHPRARRRPRARLPQPRLGARPGPFDVVLDAVGGALVPHAPMTCCARRPAGRVRRLLGRDRREAQPRRALRRRADAAAST